MNDSFDSVECCFDIVAVFSNNVAVCGNKVECCFDKVERCFDNVACCFDIVAGVDGTLKRRMAWFILRSSDGTDSTTYRTRTPGLANARSRSVAIHIGTVIVVIITERLIVTRAGIAAGMGRTFSRVCFFVCLFVRALTGKRLELSTPNLVLIYSIAVARQALTQRSKGQRSRSHGYENRAVARLRVTIAGAAYF